MPYLNFSLIVLSSLLSLAICANTQAQEAEKTTTTTTRTITPSGKVVERSVITTTVPSPKETVVIPTGYVNCFAVKAGWYQDVWIAEHSVCQYTNSPEGLAWVQGYWVCNKYDLGEGKCTNWDWKSAHWEKTFTVY